METVNNDKPWLFKKGVSGNPKGRPPKITFTQVAGTVVTREDMEQIILKLVEKAKTGSWRHIEILFDRLFGKVSDDDPQATTEIGMTIVVNSEDTRSKLEKLISIDNEKVNE